MASILRPVVPECEPFFSRCRVEAILGLYNRPWQPGLLSRVIEYGLPHASKSGQKADVQVQTEVRFGGIRDVLSGGRSLPVCSQLRTFSAPVGMSQRCRVEMWRGGVRLNISVAAPFVWRCLSGSTMAPFPHPAHRTGQADFPHPALGQDLTLSRATPSANSVFKKGNMPNSVAMTRTPPSRS
jgi:hypothetical protein